MAARCSGVCLAFEQVFAKEENEKESSAKCSRCFSGKAQSASNTSLTEVRGSGMGPRTPLFRALLVTAFLFLMGTCTVAHDADQGEAQAAGDGKKKTAEELRKRWTAAEVAHDLEHIKEDMRKMLDLQVDGELSQDEIAFYYFRMHDFDDNNLLDGQELMAATRHTIEHNLKEGEAISQDEVVELTDRSLAFDKDLDGYISYPEIRASFREL